MQDIFHSQLGKSTARFNFLSYVLVQEMNTTYCYSKTADSVLNILPSH